ncbi:unnamed protein product [Arabidopsis halleri]
MQRMLKRQVRKTALDWSSSYWVTEESRIDRNLASIPFKCQVLIETSFWWFNNTQHITPNAIVSSSDRNVVIAKKCSVFPLEFVV